MKLRLSAQEYEQMINEGSVVVVRNGFEICVNPDINYQCGFNIQVVNPYESLVTIK